MIGRLNAFLAKFVGPNAAHVIDGIIGFELTAAAAAVATPSARDYAAAHPVVAVVFGVAPPLITALASRFRQAAQAKANAPAAPPAK